MRALWIVPLLAVSLSGCISGDAPTGDIDGDDEQDAEEQAAWAAPEWQIGDYWDYLSDADEDPAYTYVVTEIGSTDYTIETDSYRTAFFDKRYDISHMGDIRVADLAGSQGSDRIEMFRFPPVEGDAWMTKWDGNDVEITITSIVGDRVNYIGTVGEQTYVEYTYDHLARWGRSYTFYNLESGDVDFATELVSFGSNWSGTLVEWEWDTVIDIVGENQGQITGNSFTVPATATDVYVEYKFECTQGGWQVEVGVVGPPGGTGTTDGGVCPDGADLAGNFEVAGEENWIWHMETPPVYVGSFELFVLIRTLVETEFPPV